MNNETKVLIAVAVGTIALLVGGASLFSRFTPQNEREQQTVDNALVLGENSPSKGAENPKVTIVEFADFQCPACAASDPIIRTVVEKYKDSVKFVFRHFPLDTHPNAVPASKAAEAARLQGKFWEMHDLLYDKQSDWAESSNFTEKAMEYAKSLGLNEEEFKKAFESNQFDQVINKGKTDGIAAGVTATPSFFVNGRRFIGGMNEARWSQIIEEELKK